MPRSPDDRELDLLLARDKAVGPAAEAMWEQVAATLPPPRRQNRWRLRMLVAAPLLAAAAAILLFIRPASDLRPKGPAAAPLVDVACSGGSRTACPGGSTLVFAVGGTDRPTFLTAWAQQEGSDQRVWYFGGSEAPLRVEPRETPAPLARSIALGPEHPPGSYQIYWQLTETPPRRPPAAGDNPQPALASGRLSLTIAPTMTARPFILAVALAIAVVAADKVAVAQPLFLSIGYNGVPENISGPALVPLRYADDDAVAVSRFAADLGARGWLLAAPDAETERRFASLRPTVRPPTLVGLRRAVLEINEVVRARGGDVSVLVFYSGHGTRTEEGEIQLTFADGGLSHEALYQILGTLRASTVHLLVDSCHAEGVVRPRDTQARVIETSPTETASYFAQQTLGRFPHVGAIIGATLGAQAHEWDVYQGGVFTHQVLSALRGAADVNGDGGIEYSEVAAFLAAANREVADPRARLRAIVRAPSANPHATLVRLSESRGPARLQGRPAWLGAFYVETMQGLRVAELRAEAGHLVELVLPSGLPLYLQGATGEAQVTLVAGERRTFESLSFGPPSSGGRGALEDSLKRGLFATSYGPGYYRGFIDRNDELVPVALPRADLSAQAPPPVRRASRPRSRWIALGAAVGLTAGAGLFGYQALSAKSEFESTRLEKVSFEANRRYERNRDLSLLLVGAAVVSGVAWFFLNRTGEP